MDNTITPTPAPAVTEPRGVFAFLTRLRGGGKFSMTDRVTYAYLLLGTFVMFGPVVWLMKSPLQILTDHSFKL